MSSPYGVCNVLSIMSSVYSVHNVLSAWCLQYSEPFRPCCQTMKKLRYRFSLLVTELRTTELVAYKTTLMAFVNCILVSCDDDLQERCRIRNEFIGKAV